MEQDEAFPADMLCLSSSEEQGILYIETASLDGETNLKVRRALPATMNIQDFNNLQASISCEQPNNSLYTFKGNFTMNEKTVPISVEQILLRVSCHQLNVFNRFKRVLISRILDLFTVWSYSAVNIPN